MRPCLIVGLFATCALFLAGCDESDEPQQVGTSFISGNIDLFEPSAVVGVMPGVVVYIDGPVTLSTVTGIDGSFLFENVPPGDYSLRFEYQGETVTYRGNSGQVLTLPIREGQSLTLIDVRISGGSVNIGNVHIMTISEPEPEPGLEPEPEPEPEPELELEIPTVIHVDDDYNEQTPGYLYDHFDQLQEGLDAAVQYGSAILYLYPGDYRNQSPNNGIWDLGVVTVRTVGTGMVYL